MHFQLDWLRAIRHLTQYVVPGLILAAVIIEFAGRTVISPSLASAYDHLHAIMFSLLTILMIGICGWTVFLWDIDRLFFKLEGKIDSEFADVPTNTGQRGPDESLLGRTRDMLNNKVRHVRAEAVAAIEKAYWDDINAGGVLAFPQPNIAAAVEHIDERRRDLLRPLTALVASILPLGSAPASIVARVLFRYVAPEVKVRLYRRLVLRFLAQLSALFVLAAFCFYLSILGWSRVATSVFNQPDVHATSIMLYQLDLMLRGALFDFMEHTHRSISPVTIDQRATAFVYYTLLFRMFVAVYLISSLFRVLRFVARRWRALLR
jgi:hypothetical protein